MIGSGVARQTPDIRLSSARRRRHFVLLSYISDVFPSLEHSHDTYDNNMGPSRPNSVLDRRHFLWSAGFCREGRDEKPPAQMILSQKETRHYIRLNTHQQMQSECR